MKKRFSLFGNKKNDQDEVVISKRKKMDVENYVDIAEESEFTILEPKVLKGHWNQEFENDKQIILELGSKDGRFLINKAIYDKRFNYVGIDEQRINVVDALEYIHKLDQNSREIDNIRMLFDDTLGINDFFERREVARIYIQFPLKEEELNDPDRSLIKYENLRKVFRALKNNGSLIFKFNDVKSYETTLENIRKMEKEDGQTYIKENYYDYHQEVEDFERTLEEMSLIKDGQPIHFIRAVRLPYKDESAETDKLKFEI